MSAPRAGQSRAAQRIRKGICIPPPGHLLSRVARGMDVARRQPLDTRGHCLHASGPRVAWPGDGAIPPGAQMASTTRVSTNGHAMAPALLMAAKRERRDIALVAEARLHGDR